MYYFTIYRDIFQRIKAQCDGLIQLFSLWITCQQFSLFIYLSIK